MFESARLEHVLDKDAFDAVEPALRTDLLDAQFDLIEAKRHAVMVVLAGPDGAGKGEVLNRLYEWLDARHLDTLAYGERTEEERCRPAQWRYWRDMPAKGEIGIVIGSWYHELLLLRATGKMKSEAFAATLRRINDMEAMLHADGVRFVKIWLHIDPEVSQKRHRRQQKEGVDTHPIVEEWGEIDTKKERARMVKGALEAVRVTSTGPAPWQVVPAADIHYRDAEVGRLVLEAIRGALAEPPPPRGVPETISPKGKGAAAKRATQVAALVRRPVTESLDMTASVTKEEYEEEIADLQGKLRRYARSPRFEKVGLVCAFEGNDAAGKGGAIRRVRQCFDPRRFRVHPVAAPTAEERGYPYLWRFWRHIPRIGNTAFFDRSWYGRVLVERVEGFCTPDDWRRAYDEINEFEQALHEAGYVVMKFWLAITPEEQMRRFKAREETSFKRFKITPEDWRNREKWPLYEAAVTEMVDRTSTDHAPWTLVPANDKRYARLKVLRTIAERLDAALD
jgi:polyphosphate:AMP phosphotransferase